MDKKILITGANGFIGLNLIKELSLEHNNIHCLVNNTLNIDKLKKFGVQIHFGDLLDKSSIKTAAENASLVFHLAAHVRPLKWFYSNNGLTKIYMDVNLTGTKNLVEVCPLTIERFIFFSSIAAAGPGQNIDEKTPPSPVTTYGKSKLEAENYLLNQYKTNDFPVVIIRPGQVYGPGHIPMSILFKFAKNKIQPPIPDNSNLLPFTFVSNLISATLSAINKGKDGNIYFIFDKHLSLRDFSEKIAVFFQRKLYSYNLLGKFIKPYVFFKTIIERFLPFKIYPFCMELTPTALKVCSQNWTINNQKAINELSFSPLTDLTSSINQTTKWYEENSII